METLFFTNVSS